VSWLIARHGSREERVRVESIVHFLTNQTTWVALEAIAVVVTAGYAIRQYREMQDVRKAQERPYVIVDFEVEEWWIKVAVLNIGAGAATDVEFSFQPELVTSRGENLSQSFWLFREGAAFLPAGKRISTLLGSSYEYMESKKPLTFQVEISYGDTGGTEWKTSMTLDLAMYKGWKDVRRKGPHEIAEALESMNRVVEKRFFV
jgi:heme/copper-type cytochrome/quinol oxidase subunit 2